MRPRRANKRDNELPIRCRLCAEWAGGLDKQDLTRSILGVATGRGVDETNTEGPGDSLYTIVRFKSSWQYGGVSTPCYSYELLQACVKTFEINAGHERNSKFLRVVNSTVAVHKVCSAN